MLEFSWRMVFYLLGALGVVGSFVWYWYYRDLPSQHTG
jgi:ACS family glucarate transporter-like MFS transporter